MRSAVIISEFNPFHDGHAHIIRKAKENGCDNVVCIMSGNFVQRGLPALCDKYTRAKAALLCGADLVLELPITYASGSAEFFAFGGVLVADMIGIADEIWFGSETGDLDRLSLVAERQASDDFSEVVGALYEKGLGFAEAHSIAYEACFGAEEALSRPNDILSVEYLKALRRIGSHIKPMTIKREGDYSSKKVEGKFASASALRALIEDGKMQEIANYMPRESYLSLLQAAENGVFPVSMQKYKETLFSFLRLSNEKQFSDCDGAEGGLASYFTGLAFDSDGADDFFSRLPTKKYTDARLYRTLLSSVLGITRSDRRSEPTYVRLLASNKAGFGLLAKSKKSGGLPVITKQADFYTLVSGMNEEEKSAALRLDEIEEKADALYTMCLPCVKNAGFFRRIAPFIAE